MKKRIIFFLIAFLCIALLITYFLNIKNRNVELNRDIYFVVDKVEITPALRCRFYDEKGNKLVLNSYTFYAPTEIKKGDIITKKINSNELIIYRVNSCGEKNIYLKVNIKDRQ